jgi:hypothetical protein
MIHRLAAKADFLHPLQMEVSQFGSGWVFLEPIIWKISGYNKRSPE